jgi:hypothetical protein
MTSTTATAAILVLLHRAVTAAIVSVFASKVTGMTSGTERCVLRCRVRKRHRDDTAMTCATAWVASMVARVVTIRIMPESGRGPAGSDMAHIALQIRG